MMMMAAGSWTDVVTIARNAYAGSLDANKVESTRSSYLNEVKRVAGLLREQDESGQWWAPGLMASCYALAEQDKRFAFCHALPRSAFFGESLVVSGYRAVVGGESPEAAKEAGRLLNIFITTLDGLCDEAPDLLPDIIPATNDMLASFPEASTIRPEVKHPVVRLIYEAGASAASILRERLRQSGARRLEAKLTDAVRAAYRTEIDGLALRSHLETSDHTKLGKIIGERTKLSAAVFNASLQIVALFAECDDSIVTRLERTAAFTGAFIGWLDDIVDLEKDNINHKPNMVAAHLIKVGCKLEAEGVVQGGWCEAIAEETQSRWRALCNALQELPQSEAFESELRRAALVWLGYKM